MSFWSGETIIQKAIASGSQLLVPFDRGNIDCASYTLSMGNEVYVTPIGDGLKPPYGDKLTLSSGMGFSIPSGQFAFLLTKEKVNLPIDVLAFISLKSATKYSGLVNVSGFHVDPGFQGNLIFAVYNAGPTIIRLAEGDKLFLIWFAELDNKITRYNRIQAGKPQQTSISSELIQKIPGHPVTLQNLAKDFENLKTRLTVVISFLTALVAVGTLLLAALAIDWSVVHQEIIELYRNFHP